MSLTKRSLIVLAFAGSSLMMCSGSDADASLDAKPVEKAPTEQELIEQQRHLQLLKKIRWYRADTTAPAPTVA